MKKDSSHLMGFPDTLHIRKDKVLIISRQSGPAGPCRAGLSKIAASDFLSSWASTTAHYYSVIMKQSTIEENRQESQRRGSTEISGKAIPEHTELLGTRVTQSSCDFPDSLGLPGSAVIFNPRVYFLLFFLAIQFTHAHVYLVLLAKAEVTCFLPEAEQRFTKLC